MPVTTIVVHDHEQRGAGHARNVGLAQVTSPLTVFLDADDTLAPTFIERCLSVFDGRKYVYTDFWQGDTLKHAPDCAWISQTWHVVSALVPTAWVRAVGGFNPALLGAEDTALYLELTTRGYCGKRLPEPLFHYGVGGQRSFAFHRSSAYAETMQLFTDKYGGKQMACCGDELPIVEASLDGGHPDGVEAMAVWAGNRVEIGKVSGFRYPRMGNGKTTLVHPADIDTCPHLWRRVEAQVQYATLEELGEQIMAYQRPPTPDNVRIIQPVKDMRPVEPMKAAPDVRKAVGLYQAANGG